MKEQILAKLQEKLEKLMQKYEEKKIRLAEESLDRREENLANIQNIIDELVMIEEEIETTEKQKRELEYADDPRKMFTVDLDGKVKKVYIVVPDFADPLQGFISENSPLAMALSNSKLGEIINYATPIGVKSCKILGVN